MARSDRFFELLKRLDGAHELALAVPALTAPLRLGSHAVYRGLELLLGERHPHERVLAQARALAREARPGRGAGPGAGRHVLFFTVRGWFVHAASDALLAKALELRGASVRFFLCGGGVPQCDFKPASDPRVTRPLCMRCTGFAGRLLEALELPRTSLAQVAPPGRRAEAEALVAGLDRAQLERWTYRDLPLLRLCLPSIQRSLLRGDPGEGPLAERVLRGFVASAVVFADACEALLEREKPDAVVATNGLFFAERIMLELARRRGIRVVTSERGWREGTLFVARDQPAARFETGAYWDAFRERPLSPEQGRRLDEALALRARGAGLVRHLWPAMQDDRAALAARLGLDPEKPMAVLFTNILWDTAIFERDAGFAGMFDWVAESVRLFARHPEAQLLIRVHPAEVRLPMAASRDRVIDRLARAFPALPPNVRVVPADDPASSYALVDLSSAVLVYTSTVGLEAALRGKPVLLCGAPHYRGCGFTRDVDGPRGYEQELLRALDAGAIHPDQVELARRYAHMLLFELMQPFPWVTDQPRSARSLNLRSLDELAPGRHAGLDRLCNAVLEGAPLVEPPA